MHRTTPLALAACIVGSVLVTAREARAGVFIGAEFDGAAGLGLRQGTSLGYGFLGELGYRIGLGPVFLQPEAAGSYMTFPGGVTSTHAARVLGGARFGLAMMVQPAIFAHAGAGFLGSSLDGPALDAGVSLGFKLVPIFSFGVQGAYNVVMLLGAGDTTKWVSFGVHAAVEF